eukprot:TRINITY_DN1523_c0_g2_i1.p1 TRINITY_DN1523_c0_g2~~TRINITY_DN1523_c0_g2_i1.p1  ORF type:complete len:394 (+),score=82.69 TRINITY_DN1523_c0_g2_i1:128-1309(+)
MKVLILFSLLIVAISARAPLHLSENVILNSYIVVFKDGITDSLRESHFESFKNMNGFTLKSTWTVIDGYSANIEDRTVVEKLLEDPIVSYVEQDQIMYAVGGPSIETQELGGLATGLWGLNRVWQHEREETTEYQYFESAGSGVDCYIVDTGIYAAHEEFTGRVAEGQTFVSDPSYPGTADGNGHGTHVASTTAGTTYGVAKEATLIPVKVLSSQGTGSNAGVIDGVNWVVVSYNYRKNPSLVNMSLGGGVSNALDAAVNAASEAGIPFVVAAGNNNQDACNSSPARARDAITIAASTNTDSRATFSNYGKCVSLFAPGKDILGAWIGSPNAYNTISGTSMASPHTAGAVAVYLGANLAVPADMLGFLVNASTVGIITDVRGSPNYLLYSLEH